MALACTLTVYAQGEENVQDELGGPLLPYPPTIAVATFAGPQFLGQFNFYQDNNGNVTATGALHKGLEENKSYHFKFYSGPNCEDLGNVLLEHKFKSMQVVNMGGTAPIQEVVEKVHLSGEDGVLDSPWVLADDTQDLACIMLKKVSQ